MTFCLFESDECGGLSRILDSYPEAKTICSEVTARQLNGFGYKTEILIKQPGEKLSTNTYELEFISYPSEMHLWEGLLVIENQRGIFFSSDLMFNLGNANGIVKASTWAAEINNIRKDQIPDPERLNQLQNTLAKFKPTFIATGHGPCLKLA